MIGSLASLTALAALVLGQGTQLPDVTTPSTPVITDCSGCYVIADVAQVIFGASQITETATQVISVGAGRNGTLVTTSFVQPNVATFSFNPEGLLTNTQASYTYQSGTIFTLSGVTLTSPTAYNVFTAYTLTSLVQNNGQCQTIINAPSTLDSAYSFAIPENAPATNIFDAENAFIQKLGGVTCSAAGVSVSTTTNVPVIPTTETSKTTGLFRPTPIAQTTIGGPTSSSTAASLTLSTSSNGVVVTFSASSGILVTASAEPSIAIGAASGLLIPSSTLFSGVVAALFALPGVLAWIL